MQDGTVTPARAPIDVGAALLRQPPVWSVDLLHTIRSEGASRPVLVLDDDPTGTQVLGDIDVELGWDASMVRARLAEQRVAYVITNSRSLDQAAVVQMYQRITPELQGIVGEIGPISIISRADSTLRGHFPVEVDCLAGGLGMPDARVILAPYFGEGGRVTLGGTHYVRAPDGYVPVAETEYASDAAFGFSSSVLREWVAERAGPKRKVSTIDLAALRQGGPRHVEEAIRHLPAAGVLIADAADESDIEVLVLGVLRTENSGMPIVARTAASYVRARLGCGPPDAVDLGSVARRGPGLVVVGSYTDSATRQLATLSQDAATRLEMIELDVRAIADRRDNLMLRTVAARISDALAHGRSAALYTSRVVLHSETSGGDLALGRRISAALVKVVRTLAIRPRWILAKGGITSYDLARHGLGLRTAHVLGPVEPGVPVWADRSPASKRPILVVVPGNVGQDDMLRGLFARLGG